MRPYIALWTAALAALCLPGSAAADFAPAPGSPVAVGAGPYWVASADFDGDGRVDLASANTDGTVSVLLRQGDGSYAQEAGSPIAVGEHADAVAVADFDADGRTDLAVSNFVSHTVTILLRRAGGGFEEEAGSPVAAGPAPHSVLAGDFNGDGRPDLALPNYGGGAVTVLLRLPGGGFEEEDGSPFAAGSGPTQLAAADFDADGRLDLAAANLVSDDVTILLRRAAGGFAPEAGSPVGVGADPVSPAVGHFNGDALPDLAVTNEAADTVTVLERRAAGGFVEQAGSPYPAGDGPYGLAAADFDDDHRTDLAVSNENSAQVTILRGVAGGGFAAAPFSPLPVGRVPLQLAAADLDGDGRTDLAVPNNADGTVSVLHQRAAVAPPARNLTLPVIVAEPGKPHTYRCLPGTWAGRDAARPFRITWQRVTDDKDYVPPYRVETVATGETYRASAATNLQLLSLSWRFQCVVEAAGAGGTTSAASPRRVLDPVVDRLSGPAYGNFRIRGIDVFQVVQPNSGAAPFGFQPATVFTRFPSAGTPTDWRSDLTGGLALSKPIDADPQSVAYAGLVLDRDKPATAKVYVDMQDIRATDRAQQLAVTLKVRRGNVVLRQETKYLRDPRESSEPWVTAAERGDPGHAVSFDVSVLHGVSQGGTFQLEASAEFRPGATSLNAHECAGEDCSRDNRFALRAIPVDSGYADSELMIRSIALTVDGQTGFPNAFDVLNRSDLFPHPMGLSQSNYWAEWDITAATVKTGAGDECKGITLRECRSNAVRARMLDYAAVDPPRTASGKRLTRNYDVLMGASRYDIKPGDAEPGAAWGDMAMVGPQGPTGPVPHFFADCCTRPITAAAHELGHILGAPHAGASCAGGKAPAWAGDADGRLQGTKFDQRTGEDTAPVVDVTGHELYDLMSYCANTQDTATTPGNAWMSPFLWNQLSVKFTELGERGLTRGVRSFPLAAQLQSGGRKPAFATGVVGPHGGQIAGVTAPDEDSAAPAPVPSSPLKLRALDTAGRLVGEAGIAVRSATDSSDPAAGSFVGPVPQGAAVVELVRDGAVLDRLTRSRPPRLRMLGRLRGTRVRAGRALEVRWTASDPDGDALQGTVEYSADGGRSWRTISARPSTGRASLPARLLPGSRKARVRVIVSDGFNRAKATSARFRVDGAPPTVRILRPTGSEELVTGRRRLLLGTASDARDRLLTGRSLTWFAGRRRLGSGERHAVRLPAGRQTLRLVATDRQGRRATARIVVRVAASPLRLLELRAPVTVPRTARRIIVHVRASAPAILRVAGAHHRVGRATARIAVAFPARPATGVLRLPFTLRPRGGAAGHVKGRIEVRRL